MTQIKKNKADQSPENHPVTILGKDPQITKVRQQKKKITRTLIFFCICLIPFLAWLQLKLFSQEISIPINSNILIFALINANVLLVLLVLFLVLRNLAELFLESGKRHFFTRLKTKLVISFLCLSLIPTIVLFVVALQFVSTSMDYWFNANIEKSLQESLGIAQNLLQQTEDKAEKLGVDISNRVRDVPLYQDAEKTKEKLASILSFQTHYGADSILLSTRDGAISVKVSHPKVKGIKLPEIPVTITQKLKLNESRSLIQETLHGDLVRNIRITTLTRDKRQALLVTTLLIDKKQLSTMKVISQGIEGYRQMKFLKGPFKVWLVIVLVIVTLLIIFCAIWFGFYISKGITEPVSRLAEATNRIAQGDLEFVIEGKNDDEIGLLVEAFNQMTTNLSESNKKLAETLAALHQSSQESEQRRRYIEVLLQNVSAGVISLDEDGKITIINRFAESLLNIDKNHYIDKRYQDTLSDEHATIISSFLEKLHLSQRNHIKEHLKVSIQQNTFSLLINITRMEDEEGTPLGYVLVFDDLTKIEKMQRMAAWREVARRIAHEIKNPLTPIQLSAQRLRRRYPEILENEGSIFDQCTNTIINQVDQLKGLVSEFSQFARMPKTNKTNGNLKNLVEEIFFLYKEAHKEIEFTCNIADSIPDFMFDDEQIKRCLINLLDNSVAAVEKDGKVDLEVEKTEESVFIRVKDNGIGTTSEAKAKLFEPYFSTKKSGTGLGLAIVSTIVADHNGYIRVTDNKPHGAVFTIELPLIFRQESTYS